MAGKHRRAGQLRCNFCGSELDTPVTPLEPGLPNKVKLIQDLQDYGESDRPFQLPRSPANPLPDYLYWCLHCAITMFLHRDPLEFFAEHGFEEGSVDGPYVRWVRQQDPFYKPKKRKPDNE